MTPPLLENVQIKFLSETMWNLTVLSSFLNVIRKPTINAIYCKRKLHKSLMFQAFRFKETTAHHSGEDGLNYLNYHQYNLSNKRHMTCSKWDFLWKIEEKQEKGSTHASQSHCKIMRLWTELSFKMAVQWRQSMCEATEPEKLPMTYSLGCFPTLTWLSPSKQTSSQTEMPALQLIKNYLTSSIPTEHEGYSQLN